MTDFPHVLVIGDNHCVSSCTRFGAERVGCRRAAVVRNSATPEDANEIRGFDLGPVSLIADVRSHHYRDENFSRSYLTGCRFELRTAYLAFRELIGREACE
jgi:hypothetical protein